MPRQRTLQCCLICAALALLEGCATATGATRPQVVVDHSFELHGSALALHLSPGVPQHRGTLIVYATGDGGWHRKDRTLFSRLVAWGYQAVGFSAPEYLKHLPRADGTATPADLGRDYAAIVGRARDLLRLPPATPVVLVGVSRGADLAVVAAGQPGMRAQLSGVVVMALTREEEYVRRRRSSASLELYPYLPRLGDVPLSVIQSTRDTYLPAREARLLFGPDTARRALHAIDARNHSFGGARDALYAALRASLQWVQRVTDLQPGVS